LAENKRTIDVLQEHFSTVWFDDHFHKDRSPVLESWTTISYLASQYPQMVFGSLVLCQSFRNPGLAAKMMATLQTLSKGRYIAGVGAGWKEDEYLAYNYDFPPARTRLDQLEEYVQILRLMWSESPATFEGKYYSILAAECEPLPNPPIPLLIGGSGEKRTLRIVAQYADWMNITFPSPESFAHKVDVLTRHCEELGRPPDSIKKSLWTYIMITDSRDSPKEDRFGRHILAGTPADIARDIAAFQEAGAEHIMVRFTDFPSTVMAERFIHDILPQF
jgi:alkanesulfonate monooxygenase SsuD/methylene tetrahydromethanopterin reductase-like flavin-dependent oxidoreductase (luciferase family)